MRTNLGLTKLKNTAGFNSLADFQFIDVNRLAPAEKKAYKAISKAVRQVGESINPDQYAGSKTLPLVNEFQALRSNIGGGGEEIAEQTGRASLLQALKSTEIKQQIRGFLKVFDNNVNKKQVISDLCDEDLILLTPKNSALLKKIQHNLKILIPYYDGAKLKKFNDALRMPTVNIIDEFRKIAAKPDFVANSNLKNQRLG